MRATPYIESAMGILPIQSDLMEKTAIEVCRKQLLILPIFLQPFEMGMLTKINGSKVLFKGAEGEIKCTGHNTDWSWCTFVMMTHSPNPKSYLMRLKFTSKYMYLDEERYHRPKTVNDFLQAFHHNLQRIDWNPNNPDIKSLIGNEKA